MEKLFVLLLTCTSIFTQNIRTYFIDITQEDAILIQNENIAFVNRLGTNIETNNLAYKDEIVPGKIEYKIVKIDNDDATI